MTSVQVHDTAPHLVVSAGRPLVSRRLRRRGPRSFIAVFRRSLRPAVRKREAVDDAAAPILDVCGGAAALVAVHAGSPMASPDHGVELRAEAVCDNTRRSRADEAPCQAGASQFTDFFCYYTATYEGSFLTALNLKVNFVYYHDFHR